MQTRHRRLFFSESGLRTSRVIVGVAGLIAGSWVAPRTGRAEEASLDLARQRGAVYAECGRCALGILSGWLAEKVDPKTHLYSRDGQWNYHNEAADHYSSLVLMAHYLEPALIRPGAPLHRTLQSSVQLCSTPSGLPTHYDLKTGTQGEVASLTNLAEWLRDGLIRLAEVLGHDNDWSREMERLVDAMLSESARQGGLRHAISDEEGQGNMLQTLARLYAMTGKEAYLTAAEGLADAVLLGDQPKRPFSSFRDHGCELVPGLGELFALECKLGRPKAKAYRAPLRQLLDAILEGGAHPVSGLFCECKPDADGQKSWQQPPDTWGYVLFTYENYDRGTGEGRYRAAVEKPLRWLLEHRSQYAELRGNLWPRSRVSDDWSDSYESMIVLWTRYPEVGDAAAWLDWATLQHVHRRPKSDKYPYGPYTGGHLDGSAGRTLCMHMMLQSQGVRASPFGQGVELGAVRRGEELLLALRAEQAWEGRLVFDGPRTEYPTVTIDWARINEMPQWFVVRPRHKYRVQIDDAVPTVRAGSELLAGLPLRVDPQAPRTVRVARQSISQ